MLLEMLVALAVMAMLAVIGTTILGYSARVLNRTAEGEGAATIALDRHTLRDWVERAVILTDEIGAATALSGSSDALTFQAILDDGSFWPGAPTTIRLAANGEGASLSVTAEGLSDTTRKPLSSTLRLSDGSAVMTIRYFGRAAPDAPAAWHSDWQAEDGLPLLLRLSISDSGMTYPPLILRPGQAYDGRAVTLTDLLPTAP